MNRLSLVLIPIFSIYLSADAQFAKPKYKQGEAFNKLAASFSKPIYLEAKNNLVRVNYEKNKYSLMVFNSKNLSFQETEINFKGKEYQNRFTYNNKFYFIYHISKKGSNPNVIYYDVFDPATLEFSETEKQLVDLSSEPPSSFQYLSVERNGKYFGLYYSLDPKGSKKNKRKGVVVMDSTFREIFRSGHEFEFENNYEDDYFIDGRGNCYALFQEPFKSRNIEDRRINFRLFKYQKNGVKELRISFPGKTISELYNATSQTGQLSFVATYSGEYNKQNFSHRGYMILTEQGNDALEMFGKQTYPLPVADFVVKNRRHEYVSNEYLDYPNYSIKNLFKEADGSFVLAFELSYTTYSSNTSNAAPIHYRGNITIHKISSNGNVEWRTEINRIHRGMWTTKFISTKFLKGKTGYRIVCLNTDNEEAAIPDEEEDAKADFTREHLLTMIGIDSPDGKKTSFTLADVRNSDVSFSTQAIYEIYPGRWIGENTVTGRGGYVLYSIEEP